MKKPFSGKKRPLHHLLIVGLYQLLYTRIPDHAAIAETVAAAPRLRGSPFKGVINGILRNVQRQRAQLRSQLDSHPHHPDWLLHALQQHYPDQWQAIIAANQRKAPMWLRVNARQHDRDHYRRLLHEAGITSDIYQPLPQALRLQQPVAVDKLPDFALGACSVQDGAAQFAAQLLDTGPGMRVLDACAAPGGKTCHIAERQHDLSQLLALDKDPQRLTQIGDNLQRLRLQADCRCADAAEPAQWWDGQPFDRILLDAPCSATGVIRRHPDIKWLRQPDDIPSLARHQRRLLNALWPLLKPGGILLYATCSVLPAENRDQIARFLATHDDADLLALHDTDCRQQPGWQILPGAHNMDGFYYAKLQKRV